jgi:hypothetical protein
VSNKEWNSMSLRGPPESRLIHEHFTIVDILDFRPREISILRSAVNA